jgi:hypothetical protein
MAVRASSVAAVASVVHSSPSAMPSTPAIDRGLYPSLPFSCVLFHGPRELCWATWAQNDFVSHRNDFCIYICII